MASLVPCPNCGRRPKEEFTIKGAALSRPEADADSIDWFDYVYLRENPRAPTRNTGTTRPGAAAGSSLPGTP